MYYLTKAGQYGTMNKIVPETILTALTTSMS